jgi:hypothetical protein
LSDSDVDQAAHKFLEELIRARAKLLEDSPLFREFDSRLTLMEKTRVFYD